MPPYGVPHPPVTSHLLQMACLVDIDLQYQEIRPDLPPEPDRRWRSLTARYHGCTYTYAVRPAEVSARTIQRLIEETQHPTDRRLIVFLHLPQMSSRLLEYQVSKLYQHQFIAEEKEIDRAAKPTERRTSEQVKWRVDTRIQEIWHKVQLRPFEAASWPPDLHLV